MRFTLLTVASTVVGAQGCEDHASHVFALTPYSWTCAQFRTSYLSSSDESCAAHLSRFTQATQAVRDQIASECAKACDTCPAPASPPPPMKCGSVKGAYETPGCCTGDLSPEIYKDKSFALRDDAEYAWMQCNKLLKFELEIASYASEGSFVVRPTGSDEVLTYDSSTVSEPDYKVCLDDHPGVTSVDLEMWDSWGDGWTNCGIEYIKANCDRQQRNTMRVSIGSNAVDLNQFASNFYQRVTLGVSGNTPIVTKEVNSTFAKVDNAMGPDQFPCQGHYDLRLCTKDPYARRDHYLSILKDATWSTFLNEKHPKYDEFVHDHPDLAYDTRPEPSARGKPNYYTAFFEEYLIGSSNMPYEDDWQTQQTDMQSSTKTINAALLVLLHNKGILNMNQPIGQFWPELTVLADATMAQLATMGPDLPVSKRQYSALLEGSYGQFDGSVPDNESYATYLVKNLENHSGWQYGGQHHSNMVLPIAMKHALKASTHPDFANRPKCFTEAFIEYLAKPLGWDITRENAIFRFGEKLRPFMTHNDPNYHTYTFEEWCDRYTPQEAYLTPLEHTKLGIYLYYEMAPGTSAGGACGGAGVATGRMVDRHAWVELRARHSPCAQRDGQAAASASEDRPGPPRHPNHVVARMGRLQVPQPDRTAVRLSAERPLVWM